ncbi:MAG: fibronectin type III domain-containing protein [Anaerolineaceae bacterium]|nr:fibronectin type III domain-containing protein [Anaerolineaceae bacterium]
MVWTPPGAPKNLRINNDGSVTWGPVEEADQYKVGWNQQGGAQSQARTFTIQSSTNMQDVPVVQPEYDIPDFDPGSDYSANVRTVTEAGAESARSFTTRDVPPSPDGLEISEFGVVTCNAVTEATHYLVNWRRATSLERGQPGDHGALHHSGFRRGRGLHRDAARRQQPEH